MSSRGFVLLLLVAGVPARAEDARFAFQTELIVDTPGRTGECDMIRFTPDGKHLLSCGDDKVIHSWSWDGKTLRADQNATLRWSIYRERRGNIYAFAVSPDGSKVAIGGHGQFVGTAAVIDRQTGKVINATTPEDSEDSTKQRSIWSMAFSPSAKRVAYGSMDGHVWAWDYVEGRHRRLGSHAELVAKRTFQTGAAKRSVLDDVVWAVEFLDEDRLVSVCQDGTVLEWHWGQKGAPRRLFRFEKLPNIRTVAFDRANRRFAASGDAGGTSTIEVRNLDGTAPMPPLVLPTLVGSSEFPRHLAFDPSGRRLAVGTYQIPQKTFYQYSGGHVYVFDLTRPTEPAWRARQLDYNAIAITWHPSQNVLAVVGGNNHDVQLLEMTRPVRRLAQLSGPGQCIWEVALARDPKFNDKDRDAVRPLLQIGFKANRVPAADHPNRKGKDAWQVFDLGERHWSSPAEAAEFLPQVALDSAGQWKWDYDRSDETLWYAITPAGTRLPLRLDKDDGFPRCYTFIPGPRGAPPQIAVGHFWGFTIFGLSPVEAKIVRRCLGHHGEVMSIAPFDPDFHPKHNPNSFESKLLITSSRDQTICCWSLEPWVGHPELGASFRPEGDWLRVTKVEEGSPASEVFKAGDLLAAFEYKGEKISGGPQQWLEIIKNSPPGPFCGFAKVMRNGKLLNGGVGSSMRQRPVWRFFPMADREWVLWRHADFYYDTSTKGDFRIGWQLSREVRHTPEFFRAEMFRARFHDPKKVEETVTTFKRTGVESVAIPQLLPPSVTLKVVAEPAGDADARVLVTATRRGDGLGQALKAVNLWVNDCLVPENALAVSGDNFRKEINIPQRYLRAGANRLTAQAFNQNEVRDETYADMQVNRPARKPNLYGLVIGVDDYSKVTYGNLAKQPGGEPWMKNLFAGTDAQALRAGWEKQQGLLFDRVDLKVLADGDVTREKVLAAVDDLYSKVGSDDYVLFSLGGHGVTTEDLAVLKLSEKPKPGAFIFCTHTTDLSRPYSTGIEGEDLFAAVRKLSGRKIVLLDTCHSGSKVNPVRKLAPAGMGPVLISACESHQSARENQGFARVKGFKGTVRGVFSIALLLALDREFALASKGGDPDAPGDPQLKANKLVEYLALVVPDAASASDPNAAQNPVAFLPESQRELPVAAK